MVLDLLFSLFLLDFSSFSDIPVLMAPNVLVDVDVLSDVLVDVDVLVRNSSPALHQSITVTTFRFLRFLLSSSLLSSPKPHLQSAFLQFPSISSHPSFRFNFCLSQIYNYEGTYLQESPYGNAVMGWHLLKCVVTFWMALESIDFMYEIIRPLESIDFIYEIIRPCLFETYFNQTFHFGKNKISQTSVLTKLFILVSKTLVNLVSASLK